MSLFRRKKNNGFEQIQQMQQNIQQLLQELKEVKQENQDLRDQNQELLMKFKEYTDESNQNQIKTEQIQETKPDPDDITDINVYIRKISQAKTQAEIEALRAKRRLLVQVRKAEEARSYKKPNKKSHKNEEYDIENTVQGGESDMDVDKIFEIYDGLNPILKKMISGYVKNKAGVDIEELKNDPSKFLNLINGFINSQNQKSKQGSNEQKNESKQITPEEIKRKADELEKEIMARHRQ